MKSIKALVLTLAVALVASCSANPDELVLISQAKDVIRLRLQQDEALFGSFMPTLYSTDTLVKEPVSRGEGSYDAGKWAFKVQGHRVECVYRHLYGGEGRFEIHELRVVVEVDGQKGAIQEWTPKHTQGGID